VTEEGSGPDGLPQVWNGPVATAAA